MRDTFVQIFKDTTPESSFSEETVQGEKKRRIESFHKLQINQINEILHNSNAILSKICFKRRSKWRFTESILRSARSESVYSIFF